MMKALLAGTLILLSGFMLFAQESGAYIRELSGTVEIKAPGAAAWTAARIGDRLSKDTMISTGFKSTALIGLGNSDLIVRPLTRLSLQEIRNIQGDETVSLFLDSGRVRAEVNPPSGGKTDFTVRAPSATASVRGTSFYFDGMNLNVDQGQVYVSGGDGTGTYVSAGHRSQFDPSTGRTTGSSQLFKDDLTPSNPTAAAAGTGTGMGATDPILPTGQVDNRVDLGLELTF
jgi:hypothetical protein